MDEFNIAPASAPQSDEKRLLRERLLTARAAFSGAARTAAEQAISAALCAALAGRAPGVLAAYWAIRGEPDLSAAWAALRAQGWSLALPVVTDRAGPLAFRAWDGMAPGARDACGLRVPPPEAGTLRPDAAVLPCVGIAAGGLRLGYGGGYYDRTYGADANGRTAAGPNERTALDAIERTATGAPEGTAAGTTANATTSAARRPWLIGVAFEFQRCEFAAGAHDLRLDLGITENGARATSARA